MIQVKQSLIYLCNILKESYEVDLDAETVRLAKKNNPIAKQPLEEAILKMLTKHHQKEIDVTSLDQDQRNDLLSFFLSFYAQPFTIIYKEKQYLLKDGSRRLLQMLAWLIFSKFNLIPEIDSLIKSKMESSVNVKIKPQESNF